MNSLSMKKKKEGFEETWFIFPTPLSHSILRRRADDAMLAAGLKYITIYGFRHSHASLLINGNMNIKLISSRLGHSDVPETLNTYTHMFPDQRTVCVNYLDSIIKNNEKLDTNWTLIALSIKKTPCNRRLFIIW